MRRSGEVLGSGCFSPGVKRTYAGSACESDSSDEDDALYIRPERKSRRRIREKTNLLEKLRQRETCSEGQFTFQRSSAREKFRNFGLQASIDLYDPDPAELTMPFQRTRSKIVEVVSFKNIIIALTKTGVCAAFSRERLKRICFMNTTSDEVVRSLFLNKTNRSLITVSVFRDDNFSSLKCRSTPLQYIGRRRPREGFALFESECLRWPERHQYKIWDLVNYDLLYSIHDPRIQEIKVSPSIMLAIFPRSSSGGYVPLQILDMGTGTVLKDFKHLLHRQKKVDFIEQFNEKLLVKQESENLQIVDVNTLEVVEVERSSFLTPSAFIFLYDTHLLLTFRNRSVSAWNFRGELVTTFEDHQLWCSDAQYESLSYNDNVYITKSQDLIISFCRYDPCRHGAFQEQHGSINISSISKGKCLAKITCDVNNSEQRAALSGMSAVFYNEERNEIYTGNRNGMVYLWSN